VLGATKSKRTDIAFEQIDRDQNPDMTQKYGVIGIPHLVFFDGGGAVLYNKNGYPTTEEDFERLIDEYK
jgi:thioredoxin-related protein